MIIKFHMANYLSIREKQQKKRKPRPGRGGNDDDANHPPRDPVPTLNREVVIPHRNPSNFWISLYLPLLIIKYRLI